MQQCGDCLKVYDESEYISCPFCSDEEEKPSSLEAFKCEECSGCGLIECPDCEGDGCASCNSAGEIECPHCDGTGWRQ